MSLSLPNRSTSRHGFTLLEILCVLLIVGSLITLVAGSMDGWSAEAKLEAAARNAASTLEGAISETILTGLEPVLVYDLDENRSWLLLPEDELSIQIKDVKRNEQARRVEQDTLPAKVSMTGVAFTAEDVKQLGEVRIRLSPTGIVTAHALYLTHESGGKMSIRIGPLGGAVNIETDHEPPDEVEELDD